jgi:hypothetical protein
MTRGKKRSADLPGPDDMYRQMEKQRRLELTEVQRVRRAENFWIECWKKDAVHTALRDLTCAKFPPEVDPWSVYKQELRVLGKVQYCVRRVERLALENALEIVKRLTARGHTAWVMGDEDVSWVCSRFLVFLRLKRTPVELESANLLESEVDDDEDEDYEAELNDCEEEEEEEEEDCEE